MVLSVFGMVHTPRVLLAAALICSCRAPTPSSESAASDSGSSAATQPSPSVPAEPPAPALPRPMPVALAQASVLDVVVPLSGDQTNTVDPAVRFLVEVEARLEDARLVLVDDRDSLIPMEGTVEIGTKSRFTLIPNEPLIPGSSYTLRLEGSTNREVRDTEGNKYLPSILRLQTSGEKPRAASYGKKRARKKQR